jgi:hypothetical protein
VCHCSANGDVVFDVTLNTKALLTTSAGPFSIAFEFSPGNPSLNNVASIGDFDFGLGAPLGDPIFLLGTVSGNLETSVILSDTSSLNVFAQQFIPGQALRFSVDLTSDTIFAGIPDALSMYILDASNVPIPTTSGSGSDFLLTANADQSNPNIQLFAGDVSRSPANGGEPIAIPAPEIGTPTAEISSIWLVCGGLAMLWGLRDFGIITRR